MAITLENARLRFFDVTILAFIDRLSETCQPSLRLIDGPSPFGLTIECRAAQAAS